MTSRPHRSRKEDPRYPGHDPRYQDLRDDELPVTECLKDTVNRFLPYWHQTIAPEISAGQRVIIAAHGNSLRALVKYLDNIPDDEIVALNIPTGMPLIYELDQELKPIRNYYLGNPEAVQKGHAGGSQSGKGEVMANWLFKSDPDVYGFQHLEKDKQTVWDGVSNHLALKHLRACKKGDRVLIYHSGEEKAIVGLAEVVKDPYPDPKQKDDRLVVVEIKALKRIPKPITLSEIKSRKEFADFLLVRMSRLSVMPVSDDHWKLFFNAETLESRGDTKSSLRLCFRTTVCLCLQRFSALKLL